MDHTSRLDDLLEWAMRAGVGELALAVTQEGVDATYLWPRSNAREIDGWGGSQAQPLARELHARFGARMDCAQPSEFHEQAPRGWANVVIRGLAGLVDGVQLTRLQFSYGERREEAPMNAKERSDWIRTRAEIRILDEAAAAGLGGSPPPRL